MLKSRFTKIRTNRTFSTSNHDPSSPNPVKKRSRSISEILDSDHTSSSPGHSPYLLTYHGYMCVDDPRSNKEVLSGLRAVRGGMFNNKLVSVTHHSGTLRVAEGTGEGILVCPLHSIGLVAHDMSKGGYSDCLAVSFAVGHYAKQCHAFQAKSNREAADIVQALQKAFRTATKERKVRKVAESNPSQTKMSASTEGAKVRHGPMQFMEDEDEVIEHKSFGYHGGRRESKKTIRLSGEGMSSMSSLSGSTQAPPSSDSTSSLQTTPLFSTKDRRKGPRKPPGTRGSGCDSEFTREDKVEQLSGAVERILENNAFLRDKARRIQTPTNIFEDSLLAMASSNYSFLSNYVTQDSAVNSHDSSGNTLLHYAVALGQLQTVRILCTNNASMEASGWNDCKPIHRAVAEGHTHILQVLLRHGADVNSLDLMRRTPLHFSSPQLELMECSIALLESGAHVMTSDLLGLRPFDLNPELKETVNRLVTSACETFVSAPLMDGGKETSPHGGTPNSTSPSSSVPSSSLDDLNENELGQLVNTVTRRARAIASRAYARRKKFQKSMTHPYSRSHDNLIELQEDEEDELMRQDKLKFPSDYTIDSAYYQMLGNKEEALRTLRGLIRASREVEKGGVARQEKDGELEGSLSEPDLYQGEDISEGSSPPRPCSSAAVLQGNRIRTLLGGNAVKFRLDSGSSSGTLKDDTDSESTQQLSRAFDILQEDLRRNSFRESQDELQVEEPSEVVPDQLRTKLRHPNHLPADASPLMERRSKEETVAIFDELLHQMEDATQIIYPEDRNGTKGGSVETGLENRNGDLGSELESGVAETIEGEQRTISKRRVQSSDVPKGLIRPSSSASVSKGEDPDAHPPRAASVETEMVFATLPKKKKRGKWSGMKRFGSPLFRTRRKSFNSGPGSGLPPAPPPPPANTHLPIHPSPSVPIMPVAPPTRLAVDSRSRNSSGANVQAMASLVDQFTRDTEEKKVAVTKVGVPTVRRRGSSPRDECLNALRVMTTLSSNQECLASLISYICLPKCVTKLLEISQNAQTTPQVLSLISTLLCNLYQSGGAEGKKTALGSGVLDLTIKLLQSREPIPSTCLSQLNQLLVSEDDNDYLRTIIRIPTAPLLLFLDECEGAEEDSGFENSSRPRRDTTETSSDATSTTTDEGVGGMGSANYLGLPPRHSGRSSSFNSETSESSSGRSVTSPNSPQFPPDLDPKRIVLKMLAVSSTHSKMQLSLSTEHAVSLLAGCSSGPSHENTTNALITLANIAQNVGSHDLFHQLGVIKQLQSLSSKGPRPRYHASRALVYMGHLDLLGDFDLFDPVATGYETDIVIYSTDSDGHSYARGATIEKCVDLLTSDISKLWGGFSLVVGPHPSKKDPLAPSLHASKDQVLQFFLTTYKSFVHPLILVRLLLHRLSCAKDSLNLFNWSKKITSISSTSQPVSVPSVQSNVLNLIGRWMELHADDFAQCPLLKEQLERVISRLKLVRGPYIPHTHRLRSLVQDMERPKTEQLDQTVKAESRPPHHDALYRLCQQMVTGGHLPITLQQAIFMASLQLHLEDITGTSMGTSSAPGTPVRNKAGTSKLKSAFPPGFSKSKSIMKRVKARRAEFETLSERNAKHLYIERCQANPGYDCAFFTVRVPSSGRFKRAPVAKQLMGINNKRIVFLDEKTKELIASHSLQSVLRITRESDPCVLLINLHGDTVGFKVQLDSAAIAKEVANILEERIEGEEILEDRWSESVPSLFTMSTEPDMADTDSSSSTIDHTPTDRGTTPPGHMLSYDMLKNPSPDGALATPNGHMETLLTHKSDTLRAFSHDDSLMSDLNDHLVLGEKEKLLFCDCPPDPEIPPEVNLKSILLVEILSCPLEVARQMTLIAHARFGELTSTELLQKVNMLPKTSSSSSGQSGGGAASSQRDSIASTSTLRSSMVETDIMQETAVEKLAFRFNQVGNWVAHSILQFEYLEERAEVMQQFIAIAKHCYDLGNFSSVMAIVVAGLGSAPIRRLHSSWAQVPKSDMEVFKDMDSVLDSRGNYKIYRDKLGTTELPAVPYVGVFLKDLTFICDGNPDYLRGGLINIHKRRQVYRLLEEIHHYQKDEYKLHSVPELQQYLLAHKPIPEDDLHATSHNVEPRIRRSHSNSSTKSLSSIQGRSFFRGFTRTASSGGLNRTSASAQQQYPRQQNRQVQDRVPPELGLSPMPNKTDPPKQHKPVQNETPGRNLVPAKGNLPTKHQLN